MTKLLHILFLSLVLASCSTSNYLPPKEEDITHLNKEQRLERLKNQIIDREKKLRGDNFSVDYPSFFDEPSFQGDITDRQFICYTYCFYDRSSGKLVAWICSAEYGVDLEYTELLSRATRSESILK